MIFSVDVNREGDRFVTSVGPSSSETDSSIVNAGPGAFFLDVLAANTDYVVTVEGCSGAPTGRPRGPIDQPEGVLPRTGVRKVPPLAMLPSGQRPRT